MRARSLVARVSVLALLGSGMTVAVTASNVGSVSAAPSTPLLTADAQPSWQTNGTIWAIEEVNGVVYVGGRFSAVRPPGSPKGQNEVPRKNMAAFDAATGALLPFNHNFAAPVTSFDAGTQPDVTCTNDYQNLTTTCDTIYKIKKSADGSKIYVSGDFIWVDGLARRKIVAFSTANAAMQNNTIDANFRVDGPQYRVRSMAVANNTVYVGGSFLQTNSGIPRTRLAAYNATTGALLPWAPTADAQVLAMVMAPDNSRVVIGGYFNNVNGTPIHGMAAVDAVSGARTPWSGNFVVPDASFVTDLVADNDTVYAAADGYGTFDGRWATNPYTGAQVWVDWCRGATWALAVIGDVLYSGSHAHNCQWVSDGVMPGGFPEQSPNRWFRMLATPTKDPVPTILHWFPSTNGGDPSVPASQAPTKQGIRAMEAVGNNIWLGGEFTLVNDQPQQGLARFTRSATSYKPKRPLEGLIASTAPGTVHLSWRAVEDLDDETLTYEVFRDGVLVNTQTQSAKPWDLPGMHFTDTGLTPGTTVTYQVRARDSRGTNSTKSFPTAVTVAGSTQRYAQAVLSDRPNNYWRFGDAAGPTLKNLTGPAATAGSTLLLGGTSGLASEPSNPSAIFDGTTGSRIIGNEVANAPTPSFSLEFSFRTGFAQGKIVGFGNRNFGDSSNADRHVYIDRFGRLVFGINSGGLQTVTSSSAYNNNQWHHVIATYGADGMRLYVDGALVGTRNISVPLGYSGFWRIGGDRLSGWPNTPTSSNYRGQLDDLSIYPQQLTAADVTEHYQAARNL